MEYTASYSIYTLSTVYRTDLLHTRPSTTQVTTAPLPSVNPALFMAPGGAKFKSFLAGLTNHVLRYRA